MEEEDRVDDVIGAILEYYNDLPDHIREVIFKQYKNEYKASNVACHIIQKYEQYPEKVRDLLFSLANDPN